VIDWYNPKSRVSEYFTVKECLWLPHWGRMAMDIDGLEDEVKGNLIRLCQKMDHVRDFFSSPIIVHCMYRPPVYSELVGGTKTDVHTKGMAADIHILGFEGPSGCEQVKQLLIPSLEALEMRLENNPGSSYLHLDIHPPGITGRYFLP
jgi:hypothetical protein